MYRTIIVDDDHLVRSFLKQMSAWDQRGFSIIADARDGEEAYELIKKEKPDVVVTDISMPIMDGIQLIRKLRQLDQRIYIVVLSCHDEFSYVREALKLGANEYLLKNSMDEDTLKELLRYAAKELEKNEVEHLKKKRQERLADLGTRSLKFHFFNQLLAGTEVNTDWDKKAAEAGIIKQFTRSAVVSICIMEWFELKEKESVIELEQYCQLFLDKLIINVNSKLEEAASSTEMIYLGEGIFCGFIDLSDETRTIKMKKRISSVANACYSCCKEEDYTYAIGTSDICDGRKGIRKSYSQAREVLKLRFYQWDRILNYEGYQPSEMQIPRLAAVFVEKLDVILKGKQEGVFETEFREVLSIFKKNQIDRKYVIDWLKEIDQKSGKEKRPEYYNKIIKFDNLYEVLEEYKTQFFHQQKMELPGNANKGIKKAVEFIHNKYMYQIGLNEVADAAGLNPAYFSYLFKKETGVGFASYVLECRLECAKDLLKFSGKKIKDVAKESGFNDYYYFSKAFKKGTGHTPAEYRRLSTS